MGFVHNAHARDRLAIVDVTRTRVADVTFQRALSHQAEAPATLARAAHRVGDVGAQGGVMRSERRTQLGTAHGGVTDLVAASSSLDRTISATMSVRSR
jgi:hypothetical protein